MWRISLHRPLHSTTASICESILPAPQYLRITALLLSPWIRRYSTCVCNPSAYLSLARQCSVGESHSLCASSVPGIHQSGSVRLRVDSTTIRRRPWNTTRNSAERRDHGTHYATI